MGHPDGVQLLGVGFVYKDKLNLIRYGNMGNGLGGPGKKQIPFGNDKLERRTNTEILG
jgi:hypothetical protein